MDGTRDNRVDVFKLMIFVYSGFKFLQYSVLIYLDKLKYIDQILFIRSLVLQNYVQDVANIE